MASESQFDPRYAAHFQRDYDPARDVAPAPRGPVRLEGGPSPTASRVPDPPRMAPTPVATEAADDIFPTRHSADDSPAPPLPTWWDWLLPAIGVGLIVIALMLWWSFVTDTSQFTGSGVNDEWTMFLQQARYILPGPLLTAGILAVTSGIVLQAVRPRR